MGISSNPWPWRRGGLLSRNSVPALLRRSGTLMLSGWHSEADGRVAQDWLQMFFWGPRSLFNKRMWSINLPSPLHWIICEVMLIQGSLSLHRLMFQHPRTRLPCQLSTTLTPKIATFLSSIYDNKENNSIKLVTFDVILLMEKKKHRFCLFVFFKYNYQKCSLRGSPQDIDGTFKNLCLVQMTSLGRQKMHFSSTHLFYL